MMDDERDFSKEFIFSSVRSGGPGGQNVNKVSTKVELRVDVFNSALLTDEEKEKLLHRAKQYITKEGELIVTSSETRSQVKNKDICIEKFFFILDDAFKPEKKRKPVKPGKAQKEKRLKEKKIQSEKKKRRSKKDLGPGDLH